MKAIAETLGMALNLHDRLVGETSRGGATTRRKR